MRIRSFFLCFSVCLTVSGSLFASEAKAPAFPATYEGGSLPLDHHKVTASIDNGVVVFTQHGQRIAVPVGNITEIACGSKVRRRLGFVPLVRLGKSETDYVGVTWTDNTRHEVLIRLNSGREYRDFVRALETSTGKKAVDAHKVATVVHYDL